MFCLGFFFVFSRQLGLTAGQQVKGQGTERRRSSRTAALCFFFLCQAEGTLMSSLSLGAGEPPVW